MELCRKAEKLLMYHSQLANHFSNYLCFLTTILCTLLSTFTLLYQIGLLKRDQVSPMNLSYFYFYFFCVSNVSSLFLNVFYLDHFLITFFSLFLTLTTLWSSPVLFIFLTMFGLRNTFFPLLLLIFFIKASIHLFCRQLRA